METKIKSNYLPTHYVSTLEKCFLSIKRSETKSASFIKTSIWWSILEYPQVWYTSLDQTCGYSKIQFEY